MSESEVDSGWTPENLQRLFSAMKKNISNQGREKSYIKGIKNVKWETVAFPPFSPSQCKEKWMDVFRTLQKMRSLTELIVDAESRLLNPRHKVQSARSIFLKKNHGKFKKENPELSNQELFRFINRKYFELSNKEKAKYEEKVQRARKEKVSKLRAQCFPFHVEEQGGEDDGSYTRHAQAKKIFRELKFPARTNQLVFLKEKMNQLRKEIPIWQERFGKVCQMWADLPKSQRNKYMDICNAGKLKYKNELQQWFETRTPTFQAMYLERNPSKRKYLDINKANCQQRQEALFLPSDSEDEDIVCSSDEEDDLLESEKDEEREEQEDSFIFEIY